MIHIFSLLIYKWHLDLMTRRKLPVITQKQISSQKIHFSKNICGGHIDATKQTGRDNEQFTKTGQAGQANVPA